MLEGGEQRLLKIRPQVDPNFTRGQHQPWVITYSVSAPATWEVTSAGGTKTEEPAPLPTGVLSVYSDGTLECSLGVGASVTGGPCTVVYPGPGDHSVTTTYTSGAMSVTETETMHIVTPLWLTPFEVSYSPGDGGASHPDSSINCTKEEGVETCDYHYWWGLGTFKMVGETSAGPLKVTCAAGSYCPAEIGFITNPLDGWQGGIWSLVSRAIVTGPIGSLPSKLTCEEMKAFATSDSSPSNVWYYADGVVSLRAVSILNPSVEATATVDIAPTLPC